MNEKFERIKNNCFSIASRFLCCYKYYLLVFFILFFIGFLTGIFTCSGFAKDLEVEHLINPYHYDFLKNEMTFFSYFLTLAVYFLILSFFSIICVRNKFFIGLNAVILALLAYIFGFDLSKKRLTLEERELMKAWEEARKAKDFTKADELRAQLQALNVL